jgi:S-adenosylmethionine synthetase
MLNLNKPIYEKTAAYGTLEEHQMIMVHFLGKKTDKTSHFSK